MVTPRGPDTKRDQKCSLSITATTAATTPGGEVTTVGVPPPRQPTLAMYKKRGNTCQGQSRVSKPKLRPKAKHRYANLDPTR